MGNFIIVFMFIVVFSLFILGGVVASIFWMKTSEEAISRITDKSKKFLWYYGYGFFIFIIVAMGLSFIIMLSILTLKITGLINV